MQTLISHEVDQISQILKVLLIFHVFRFDASPCQVDIKFTDKKKSGSEILLTFTSHFTFCVFFIFAIKHIIKSDIFTSRLMVL